MLYLAYVILAFWFCTVGYADSTSAAALVTSEDTQAVISLAGSAPAVPRWVIYADKGSSAPTASSIPGYNVVILSFLLIEGPWDQVQEWVWLTADERAAIKAEYAAAGISLIVSAFGSTDVPTTTNADPIATANTMAAFVIEYDLDGIDVDYEDFNAMDAGDGKAEAWLISFTQQLRTQLPQGDYILTHAPVAPWFSPNIWGGGGYLKVDSEVGDLIDWYNVQFYNQGSDYTTCDGLLTASSAQWPSSALFQIAASGVSLSKLVIGKPATASDASTGYIAPATLADCVAQAKDQGWDAGVMVWEWPDAAEAWIETVRASSWPV